MPVIHPLRIAAILTIGLFVMLAGAALTWYQGSVWIS